MAQTSYNYQKVKAATQTSDDGFLKRHWRTLLVAGFVLLSMIVGLVVSAKWFFYENAKFLIEIYGALVGLTWFAFAASRGHSVFKDDDLSDTVFLYLTPQALIFSFPVVLMIISPNAIWFWLSLIIFVYLGIRGVLADERVGSSTERAFAAVYAAWLVSGIIVTLGTTSFLPYAQSVFSLSNLTLLLEVRVVVTGIFLSAFVAKAMFDAFHGPKIDVPELPDLTFGQDDRENNVAGAGITVLNGILSVVQFLTQVVWSLIYHIGMFLYRTGINLAEHIHELIVNSLLWWRVFRVVASFLVLVVFGLLVSAISSGLAIYLGNSTSLFTISMADFVTLVIVGLVFIFTACLIAGAIWLWEYYDAPLNWRSYPALTNTSHTGFVILVVWAISSLILLALAKLSPGLILGFETLGLFTLMVLGFIGLALVYRLAKLAKNKPARS